MSDSSSKTFDCVESLRQARDRLSAEIKDMSYAELVTWLRTRQYADPILRRLAEEAAQQDDAADAASRRR